MPWATVAFLGVTHAAAEGVAPGRLDAADAGRQPRRAIARVLGVSA